MNLYMYVRMYVYIFYVYKDYSMHEYMYVCTHVGTQGVSRL